ncbi:MAG: DUF2306 domain-containing protein [Caldilineaceae bacterium]
MVNVRIARPNSHIDRLLRWSTTALVATVWLSAVLFGLYIFLFYLSAYWAGELVRWNEGASELYAADTPLATTGIGLHFLGGALILFLGSIQLIERIRNRYLPIHRWIGRLYVALSLLTAIGGLTFILIHGTIGGTVMDIGFALYGVLMFWAAVETIRHARAGRLERHRAWALRLYVLAIGSWLYRMEYGIWFLFTEGMGSTPMLTGPFDRIMAFFFYLPNLFVLELFFRAHARNSASGTKVFAALGLLLLTGLLLLMTLGFVAEVWMPKIWGPAVT